MVTDDVFNTLFPPPPLGKDCRGTVLPNIIFPVVGSPFLFNKSVCLGNLTIPFGEMKPCSVAYEEYLFQHFLERRMFPQVVRQAQDDCSVLSCGSEAWYDLPRFGERMTLLGATALHSVGTVIGDLCAIVIPNPARHALRLVCWDRSSWCLRRG